MWSQLTNPAKPEGEADFERASKPRRQPMTFVQLLKYIVGAALSFWAITLLLTAMQAYNHSSSDHLILGTWRSLDNPDVEWRFDQEGFLTVFYQQRARPAFQTTYHFLAQSTVDFGEYWEVKSERFPPMHHGSKQAKVQFAGSTMRLTDAHNGMVTHWRRP
jgi:hypothetical protein